MHILHYENECGRTSPNWVKPPIWLRPRQWPPPPQYANAILMKFTQTPPPAHKLLNKGWSSNKNNNTDPAWGALARLACCAAGPMTFEIYFFICVYDSDKHKCVCTYHPPYHADMRMHEYLDLCHREQSMFGAHVFCKVFALPPRPTWW